MTLCTLLKMFKLVDVREFTQIEPSVIKSGTPFDDKVLYYTMNSRVLNYNHNDCLDINKTMSKKLFEGFNDIWIKIVDGCHNNSDNKFFDTAFIEFQGYLVDYFPEVIPDGYVFNDVISSIIKDIEDSGLSTRCVSNLNGEFTIVVDNKEESTSVMIICMNLNKSYFSIHQGRYDTDGRILLFNKPSTETGSLIEFLNAINEIKLSEQFEVLNTLSNEISDIGEINLSYRELLDFIKFSKMDLIEDGMGIVADINNLIIFEETKPLKEKLIQVLRCYPYKSLKKMNWLRKSLKSTNISTAELLKLFSDNILNEYTGISPFILADLYGLRMESDNSIVKDSLKKA